MVLVPDTAAPSVYHGEIEPNLRDGALLMFAHGFNIHFGEIDPPGGIDVGMVAPKGPGHLVRRLYEEGGGVPALFAVHRRDRDGAARTLAYARGDRRRARRRPRDHVRRGDRDRPVRRAGGALRRRDLARAGRLRDAGRRRLPAGARLLRDDARAEAHRRPACTRAACRTCATRSATPPSSATTSPAPRDHQRPRSAPR